MLKVKPIKLLWSCLFFVFSMIGCMPNVSSGAGDAAMVWSQPQGDEYPVFYSKQADGRWGEPVKLTRNDRINVVPALTSDSHDDTWVVWAVLEGAESYLYYKKHHAGAWSGEVKIDTGLSVNTAPSVAVDGNGVLWLAWAGFDGQDDEIFYASWNGSAFTPAARITDNQVPDVLPVLGFDSQKRELFAQWSGYDGQKYQTYYSVYGEEGVSWGEPALLADVAADASRLDSGQTMREQSGGGAAAVASGGEVLEVELPDFVQSLPSVSIHAQGMSIQSLPSRLMRLDEK